MYPAHFDGMPDGTDPPIRVLLAEDDFLIRLDFADSLRSQGFEVVEVSSADEAMELLKFHVSFNLVITDLNMPGRTDGVGLAKFVRNLTTKTGIVLVSSEPRPSEPELFDLVLRKPVWDLGARIMHLIGKAGYGD